MTMSIPVSGTWNCLCGAVTHHKFDHCRACGISYYYNFCARVMDATGAKSYGEALRMVQDHDWGNQRMINRYEADTQGETCQRCPDYNTERCWLCSQIVINKVDKVKIDVDLNEKSWGCSCPLYDDEWDMCNAVDKRIPHETKVKREVPDFCPLKKGPVTINAKGPKGGDHVQDQGNGDEAADQEVQGGEG